MTTHFSLARYIMTCVVALLLLGGCTSKSSTTAPLSPENEEALRRIRAGEMPYWIGSSLKLTDEEREKLIREVETDNSIEAALRLRDYYAFYVGDSAASFGWTYEAAHMDYADSQRNLGGRLIESKIAEERQLGVYWLCKAIEANNEIAKGSCNHYALPCCAKVRNEVRKE